jgi:glutamate racemase
MPADSRSSLPSSLHNAIGIFDSGVGGLSVLKAIRAALPQEDLVYVADSAHAPYGERSEDFITQRTLVLGEWLARQGVKAITIACNTATVVAAKRLRDSTQVPVIAIEPAIKPAAGLTRSGVIAVLATRQTVQSESVARLCELHGGGKKILLQACPGWVERVEAADLTSPHTLALLREVLAPLLAQGADTLVLGCTHYPFLRAAIQSIAGEGVQLIDPAEAVARELVRRLPEQPNAAMKNGQTYFFTTGNPYDVAPTFKRLWGEEARVQHLANT